MKTHHGKRPLVVPAWEADCGLFVDKRLLYLQWSRVTCKRCLRKKRS